MAASLVITSACQTLPASEDSPGRPWAAEWIGLPASEPNLWTCFRKTFSLGAKPSEAIARIGVDSKYWLWVNGELVIYEGGLKRGPTPNDTYFDTVDLAPYLKEGNNTIAVLAWYWGKEGFCHKDSGQAGFLFDLTAGDVAVVSDASWRAQRHLSYGNTGEPHPNYRLPESNIHYDGRKDPGEWMRPDYDDAAWSAAATFGKPPTAPWNRLVERPIPQWRTSPLLAYEKAGTFPRVSDGKPVIARLPANLTVSPYLKIKAPAGLVIDLRTDNYNGGSEFNVRSEYVTRDGVQEFESLAYMNGHWMIYSIPEGVEILDLRYRETRYDTDYTGSFECDDPFLNALWLKSRNTMNVNMRDSIQDPDRERSQWWGDIVILMSQIFHTCDARAHSLVRKAIDNLVDWQKPDGVLYSPIPAGSWDKELPQQMLASIGLYGFWNYYLHTGDRETIERAYPAVKRYLSLWELGPDGLVVHRKGGWDWTDWGEDIDVPVIENVWLYQALESAIRMARLTGNEADIPGYEAMKKRLEESYNRALWRGGEYRSPGYEGKTDDRGHGLAVVFGLAKPEQFPAIKDVLSREFHSSPYTEKYVLESLFLMGDPAAAIARMKKRYQKMVESEYSTLWEGWGIGAEGYGGGTYNHGWSGGPLTLLTEYVAGVTPASPAYATYQVRPQMGPLKHVRTVIPTLKGPIRLELAREEKRFRLDLESPAGTLARVCIPLTAKGSGKVKVAGETIWGDGKAASVVPGVKPLGEVDGFACFEVVPGTWEFLSEQQ